MQRSNSTVSWESREKRRNSWCDPEWMSQSPPPLFSLCSRSTFPHCWGAPWSWRVEVEGRHLRPISRLPVAATCVLHHPVIAMLVNRNSLPHGCSAGYISSPVFIAFDSPQRSVLSLHFPLVICKRSRLCSLPASPRFISHQQLLLPDPLIWVILFLASRNKTVLSRDQSVFPENSLWRLSHIWHHWLAVSVLPRNWSHKSLIRSLLQSCTRYRHVGTSQCYNRLE